MENLEKYIKYLIARHNCVIIPGLGAFLTRTVPARYNVEEQVFTPPHLTLGFNPQVNIDDALLVSGYMENGKRTYKEAADIMQNDIRSLRRLLSHKGMARLGELGTFMMDINGCITFEPDVNGIDDPNNYGFEPLSIEQLHRKQEKTITIKRRDLRKYIAAVAAIILTFLFVTPVSDKVFDGNIKASLSDFASSEKISMMQQLATSAPARISDNTGCEISPVQYSGRAKITEPQPVSNEKPAEPNSAAKESAATENQPTGQVATQIHYIIVASSPNSENANLAIKELTAKFAANYTIVKCGKRHRIAIDSYESEKQAMDALTEYQKTFHDAWILSPANK